MSRHTTTHFYIASWVVWVVAVIAFFIVRRHLDGANTLLIQDPNLGALAAIIDVLALVMAFLIVVTLYRLAKQHDWGWFVAVLVLQLIGLGIAGMVAYAIAGPVDIDISKPGIT